MLDRDRPPVARARAARHAAAMRRLRQREREGVLRVTVFVTPAHTAKLEALRYLRAAEVEDRRAVAAALLALLDAIER
jgi:hypothetical protein